MAHVVTAEVELAPESWASSIPPPEVLTVDDALRACDRLMAETRAALEVPALRPTPEWSEAAGQVKVLADGLQVYAAHDVHRLRAEFNVKLRRALVERGLRLYAETARMLDDWRGRVDYEQARAKRLEYAAGGGLLGGGLLTLGAIVLGLLWAGGYLGREVGSRRADLLG